MTRLPHAGGQQQQQLQDTIRAAVRDVLGTDITHDSRSGVDVVAGWSLVRMLPGELCTFSGLCMHTYSCRALVPRDGRRFATIHTRTGTTDASAEHMQPRTACSGKKEAYGERADRQR